MKYEKHGVIYILASNEPIKPSIKDDDDRCTFINLNGSACLGEQMRYPKFEEAT